MDSGGGDRIRGAVSGDFAADCSFGQAQHDGSYAATLCDYTSGGSFDWDMVSVFQEVRGI